MYKLILIVLIALMLSVKVIASTVLVFSPHPDDDIIGCGGTIYLHRLSNDVVITIYITSGGAALWKGITGSQIAQIRENEARQASLLLGVENILFLRQHDSAVNSSENEVKKIISLFKEYKPDIVYAPHIQDSHSDHKATFELVLKALQFIQSTDNPCHPKMLCYEVWTPLHTITHKNNISQCIDHKLAALSKHESQLAASNYIDAIKGLNRYRGILFANCDYAECFFELKY